MADDGSGDVVVRLYEAGGGHADATVTPTFGATSVVSTDLLERLSHQVHVPLEASHEVADDKITLFVEERPAGEIGDVRHERRFRRRVASSSRLH